MSDDINVHVTSRSVFGKGASRRLRRESLVPAILYGAEQEPQPVTLKHNEVVKHLENEQFYSSLLMLSVDGAEPIRTILRDVQRHPFKQQILHMDFQRVVAGAELQISVPLHFTGEDKCPGVKEEAGIVSHNENEVLVSCRPRDIPEFIEVDMSALHVGESVHLSSLVMAEGVRLVDLKEAGDDSDRAVGSIVAPRVVQEVEDTDEDAGEGAATDESKDDSGDQD